MDRREESEAGPGTGPCLRRLRERLGLTREQMADRLGLSPRALGGYELGERQPGLAVLRRCRALDPQLPAHELLGVAEDPLPAADARVAPAWTELFGFRARRLHEQWLRAAPDPGPHARRLRCEAVGLSDDRALPESLRAHLLFCVAQGAPAARGAVSDLELGGDGGAHEAGGDRHRVAWTAGDEGRSFDYELEAQDGPAQGAERDGSPEDLPWMRHEVLFPVELLELSCPPPAGSVDSVAVPRLAAWPAVTSHEAERDVAALLHPDELEAERDGECWRVRVRDPLPGLCYGITRASLPNLLTPVRAAGDVAALLRELRSGHGLSLREAAKRLGVSHGTVRNVESGTEPPLPFLRRCLEVFPELKPEHLLPPVGREGPLTPVELWGHARAVFGLAARAVDKHVRVQADGRVRSSLRTRGLRDLRRARELRLRDGGLLEAAQAAPHVVEAITGGGGSLRIRAFTEPDGSKRHVLQVEGGSLRGGLSYGVRHALSAVPLYNLTTERAGRPGPLYEGSSHAIRFPCERLTYAVTLPAGYEPAGFGSLVIPNGRAPSPLSPSFSEALKAPEVQVSRRAGRLTARIDVERPLIGFKYAVTWQLP